jgi:hypothetical protein
MKEMMSGEEVDMKIYFPTRQPGNYFWNKQTEVCKNRMDEAQPRPNPKSYFHLLLTSCSPLTSFLTSISPSAL